MFIEKNEEKGREIFRSELYLYAFPFWDLLHHCDMASWLAVLPVLILNGGCKMDKRNIKQFLEN